MRRVRPGTEIIRGAAGSGKTTTAVLKLKLLLLWALSIRKAEGSDAPVRALVLTFNRTLRGYIDDLVQENIPEGNVELNIDTCSHWAYEKLGRPQMCDENLLESFCSRAASTIGLTTEFLLNESNYVMGRFLPHQLSNYLNYARDGRGLAPRVDKPIRQLILDLIVDPYNAWKATHNVVDWNDLAILMSSIPFEDYDIIIADEAQDFSANQIRAILAHKKSTAATSFVLDTAQRIYAGGFTWAEVGLTIRPEDSHRLKVNYRNTPEISRLSASLINHVPLDEDGTRQELSAPVGNARPILLEGLFSQQVDWCIDYLRSIDITKESVAFLHPKGWFSYLESRLAYAGINFVNLTQRRDWPQSNINIALSTLHSAKGLDFDHAILIGLSKESLPDGEFGVGDERFETASRLLSMAIARAKINVVLGFKQGDAPALLANLDSTVYDKVVL